MFRLYITLAIVASAIACSAAPGNAGLPSDISRQLPPGYTLLSSATSSFDRGHTYYVVALASETEVKRHPSEMRAPARPLLIFERRAANRYALIARNDNVLLRADDGGINGCDPFEERRIAVKGRYFTIEHGVACGAHWTDYVTFRFDAHLHDYIFDNWRTESWSLSPENHPNGDALVSDGVKIVRAASRPVPFAKWRRP